MYEEAPGPFALARFCLGPRQCACAKRLKLLNDEQPSHYVFTFNLRRYSVASLVPPYTPDEGHHGTCAAIEYAITALKVGPAGYCSPRHMITFYDKTRVLKCVSMTWQVIRV